MAAELSAVLPLKTVGSHYAENLGRCDILMASLRAFAAPGLLRKIYLVCPGDEVGRVERAARSWAGLPIEVRGEDDLLPFFRRYPRTAGWWRQQIIKLHAARLVETDFFLTLDPDVLLCKPLGPADLFGDGGRALADVEPRSLHPEWWRASAALLGVEPRLDAEGMSVTPALLSRDVCVALGDELASRHGVDWREALLAALPARWTEYTLYWLAAEKLGLAGRYHLAPGEAGARRLLSPDSVWSKDQWAAWRPDRLFAPDAPGFFGVVQSNTRVSPRDIARRVAPHLAVELRHRGGPHRELASLLEDAWRTVFGRRGAPARP